MRILTKYCQYFSLNVLIKGVFIKKKEKNVSRTQCDAKMPVAFRRTIAQNFNSPSLNWNLYIRRALGEVGVKYQGG